MDLKSDRWPDEISVSHHLLQKIYVYTHTLMWCGKKALCGKWKLWPKWVVAVGSVCEKALDAINLTRGTVGQTGNKSRSALPYYAFGRRGESFLCNLWAARCSKRRARKTESRENQLSETSGSNLACCQPHLTELDLHELAVCEITLSILISKWSLPASAAVYSARKNI
jgi:hypothetical protein